jgi:hypothetical protein
VDMEFRGGLPAGWRRALGWVAFVAAGYSPLALCAEPTHAARILYFEPIRIKVPGSEGGQRKSSAELGKLAFTAYGRSYSLSVAANETFHSSLALKPSRSSLKLYRGSIDGLEGSWVRLATKGVDVHGMLWDGVHLYVIAPSYEVREQLLSPEDSSGETIIFRLNDVLMSSQGMACDTTDSTQRASEAYESLVREISPAEAQNKFSATLRLELSVLGDARFRERYADAQEARDAILLRLNNVDGIFSSQLGVQIEAPTVQVHDQVSDPLSTVASAAALLDELASVRRRSPELRKRGLTHLFTGRNLEGTTVGIAYMDSLCDTKLGVGLTEVDERGSWYESLIAAHEIGHNFGAVHDGDPNKACASTPQGLFLMSPNVNGVDSFSQCSLQLMRPNISHATCIAPLPPANISVLADLGTLRHPVGTSFQWELPVANAGGAGALGVRAEILVPPSVIVEDAYVVGGSCTSGAGIVQCQLGDIAGGTSRAVSLTMRGDVVGSSSLSTKVFAQNDVDTSNNQGDGTILIEPEADVSVSLEAPAQVRARDAFEVRIHMVNASTIEATDIRASLLLPAGFTAASGTLNGGSCAIAADGVTCTLASLATGKSATSSISLSSSLPGTAILRAEISGTYVDPDASNDAAEVSIQTSSLPSSTAAQASAPSSGGGGSTKLLFLGLLGLLGLSRRARLAVSG